MLDAMTSRQYLEWLAFYNLEPWGEHRGDLRAGIIASTIANVNRGKNQEAVEPLDFMPYQKQAQEQSPDEIKFSLRSILRAVEDGQNRNNSNRLDCENG